MLAPSWGWAQNYPRTVNDLVAKVKAGIKTIDMAAFKAGLDRKAQGLVIDVREPDEFAGGHIPNAINIPRGQIELAIWSQVGYPDHVDMRKPITLYCSSGTRSILAARSLRELGFKAVVAVDMKLEAWNRAHYPMTYE
ncbi:rhodanese-like domain-containing protein [Parasulfuritortus cantonensis]|uniref:Rhodanese-like domain-containing protein n=1 Tax=Parasulfuritortus cantonensis TaxID=2528202 RepID=A0A4R1B4X9_9PROT|nr:rhodanese-like domain-containing protein [Parasulfuritortus cantonensis]TCJ11497.1 rhodanese-like domain-containing protein [Parasulfuritortus cantonensis]